MWSIWIIFIFGITCLAGEAAAQVLNMSHDLVRLGIASQNLTPNDPSLDARPLIQAAAYYVQTHQVQTLTADPGAYYLLSATTPCCVTLIFPFLSNMTVDLAGSTIYFMGPLLPNGIEVYQCSNFTLTNFSTDFLTPPYTHVQLTSIDPVNRVLYYQQRSPHVRFCAGFTSSWQSRYSAISIVRLKNFLSTPRLLGLCSFLSWSLPDFGCGRDMSFDG